MLGFYFRSFVLIVALALAGGYGIKKALESRKPPPVKKQAEPELSVRVFQPSRIERRPVLFLIGEVEAIDYASVTSPVEADVQDIRAREGDYFSADSRLVRLDLREQELDLSAQKASLADLRSQLESVRRNRAADGKRLTEMRRLLELAESEHARNRSLVEKEVMAASKLEASEKALLQRQLEFIDLENRVSDYDTQTNRLWSQIRSAQARVEKMELSLEQGAIRAPFDGRVAQVHTAVGARVSRGAALLDIFNPSRLRLRVAVPQRYIGAVRGDREIDAVLEGRGLTLSFAGLEPRVERGNSSIDVFFSLPWGDWVLGSVHDLVLELPPVESFVAPTDAIYNDNFLYRVNGEGRAQAVECERLGLARLDERVGVLLDCPELDAAEAAEIVVDQLPNLLDGVKLKIVDSVDIEMK